MTEELPRFVYLHCSHCKAWLALFGPPSRATPKLEAAAPHHGWTQDSNGNWTCSKHAQQAGE